MFNGFMTRYMHDIYIISSFYFYKKKITTFPLTVVKRPLNYKKVLLPKVSVLSTKSIEWGFCARGFEYRGLVFFARLEKKPDNKS